MAVIVFLAFRLAIAVERPHARTYFVYISVLAEISMGGRFGYSRVQDTMGGDWVVLVMIQGQIVYAISLGVPPAIGSMRSCCQGSMTATIVITFPSRSFSVSS